MTDEAALLAAILANRDDNTVRLVYSDWLEGDAPQRQPESAAFIRAQARRERCAIWTSDYPTIGGYCLGCPGRDQLEELGVSVA